MRSAIDLPSCRSRDRSSIDEPSPPRGVVQLLRSQPRLANAAAVNDENRANTMAGPTNRAHGPVSFHDIAAFAGGAEPCAAQADGDAAPVGRTLLSGGMERRYRCGSRAGQR